MCDKTMYHDVDGEIYVTLKLPELNRDSEFLMKIINKHVEMNDITIKNTGKDFVDIAVKNADGFADLATKIWVYRTSLQNGDLREFILGMMK